MTPAERRAFLESHRLCILGYARKTGPPSLTPVYYVMDGDDLLISTTASRGKARAVRRNPAVSVCVLHEQFPFPYLLIFGRGRIETEGVVDVMLRVGEKMRGQPADPAARAAFEARAAVEGRVVLRVTPTEYFGFAPRGQSPPPPPPGR